MKMPRDAAIADRLRRIHDDAVANGYTVDTSIDLATLKEAADTLTRPAAGDFVMVPKEPTEEMLEAYQEAMCGIRNITSVDDDELVILWKAMLSAAPQQHGQEVVDALPWGWKWLTCSAAHRADAVANIRQMAEDIGAYDEPAGIIPALTQAQLLASIADALEADSLFERSESPSAQQPAEAVEWQVRYNSIEGGWSQWRPVTKGEFDAVNAAIRNGACSETRALYTTPPPAIEIHQTAEAVATDVMTPRPMETAPRDGTMVRLLVQFDEHATEDIEGPAWTIGANNFDNEGDEGQDRWKFAGWCWSHDHFTEGKGTPIGWLPLVGNDTQPPAIDIGKLRELVSEWRNDAKHKVIRVMAKQQLADADQLAALMGDGGRAQA